MEHNDVHNLFMTIGVARFRDGTIMFFKKRIFDEEASLYSAVEDIKRDPYIKKECCGLKEKGDVVLLSDKLLMYKDVDMCKHCKRMWVDEIRREALSYQRYDMYRNWFRNLLLNGTISPKYIDNSLNEFIQKLETTYKEQEKLYAIRNKLMRKPQTMTTEFNSMVFDDFYSSNNEMKLEDLYEFVQTISARPGES